MTRKSNSQLPFLEIIRLRKKLIIFSLSLSILVGIGLITLIPDKASYKREIIPLHYNLFTGQSLFFEGSHSIDSIQNFWKVPLSDFTSRLQDTPMKQVVLIEPKSLIRVLQEYIIPNALRDVDAKKRSAIGAFNVTWDDGGRSIVIQTTAPPSLGPTIEQAFDGILKILNEKETAFIDESKTYFKNAIQYHERLGANAEDELKQLEALENNPKAVFKSFNEFAAKISRSNTLKNELENEKTDIQIIQRKLESIEPSKYSGEVEITAPNLGSKQVTLALSVCLGLIIASISVALVELFDTPTRPLTYSTES